MQSKVYVLGETRWFEINSWKNAYRTNDINCSDMLESELLKMGAKLEEEQWNKTCPHRNVDCPKCKSSEVKEIEKIKPGEICNSEDEKPWYHDLFVINSKLNEIIDHLSNHQGEV